MEKYKHYIAVKSDDSYYGLVTVVDKKDVETFYSSLKKIEANCTIALLKNLAAKYGEGVWQKFKNTKTIQKLAKQSKCDIIYTITTNEKSILK